MISHSTPAAFELTDEFRHALDLLEKGSDNLFITGRAGTGKSTLLQQFRSQTTKSTVVLAPTGVAAVNVRGTTIHSFFGFKPNSTLEGIKKLKGERLKIYKGIDTIVIDEISMVRADLLDNVARFLELNGPDPGKPFGGVQMVFFGDLYQLPPVVQRKEEAIFRHHYETPYFFSAQSFQSLSLAWIELTRVFRQTDSVFLTLLNRIRNQTISDQELDLINARVIDRSQSEFGESPISLTTTNKQAATINLDRLDRLPGREQIFEARVEGDFERGAFPTEERLILKEGAQVMLLNNDGMGRWVNGTLATIKRISTSQETLSVLFSDQREEEVSLYRWDLFHFEMDAGSKRLKPISVGTFTQMPVCLAWAITIHKSQGLTFDQAVIDLTRRTFVHGQLYVAISRLRTLEGLILTHPVKKEHILLDYRIQKFITTYQYRLSDRRQSVEEKILFLREAILKRQKIEIVYLKSSDEKSRRGVLPISVGEMTFAGKRFVGMVAYCDNRREERTFRVDRILTMQWVETT
jgi:ATP-dependent exoDNAse (exonuclease V) alpha subunit